MSEEQINPPDENKEATGEAKNPDNTPPLAAVDIRIKDRAKNDPASSADKKTRKRKRLSCFEIGTLILGTVGILFAGGTGVAIVWQDIIANASLTEMQQQRMVSENSQAAHLSIEDISSTFEPCNGDRQCFTVSFTLWNRGNSIATNVTGNVEPLQGRHPYDDVWKELCADVKPSVLGFSLPQGEKFPTPYRSTFEGQEWYWVIKFVYLDEFGRVQSLPACLYPHRGRVVSCLPGSDNPKYQKCPS
jgi:hypothetical protein